MTLVRWMQPIRCCPCCVLRSGAGRISTLYRQANQYLQGADGAGYEAQARARYDLEPYISELARFEEARGKRVLEIGVGLSADHQKFAEAGAILRGIDLTKRAIDHVRQRLQILGLASNLQVADAENLPFDDEFFDLVYSWGCFHHTPNTAKAIDEAF